MVLLSGKISSSAASKWPKKKKVNSDGVNSSATFFFKIFLDTSDYNFLQYTHLYFTLSEWNMIGWIEDYLNCCCQINPEC